ncbi:MAG: phage GP46 family protein [Desulfobacterales bacterium]|nr:phage GP46 family protein [Desulfobacterales bacterium]
MDYQLTIDGVAADMSWERSDSIINNLWLSLMVPLGGFFAAPAFGSRLHLLRREKLTPRTVALARQYCLEATRWLIDLGRATQIEVEAIADHTAATGRVLLKISAVQADGRTVTFSTFIEVV